MPMVATKGLVMLFIFHGLTTVRMAGGVYSAKYSRKGFSYSPTNGLSWFFLFWIRLERLYLYWRLAERPHHYSLVYLDERSIIDFLQYDTNETKSKTRVSLRRWIPWERMSAAQPGHIQNVPVLEWYTSLISPSQDQKIYFKSMTKKHRRLWDKTVLLIILARPEEHRATLYLFQTALLIRIKQFFVLLEILSLLQPCFSHIKCSMAAIVFHELLHIVSETKFQGFQNSDYLWFPACRHWSRTQRRTY